MLLSIFNQPRRASIGEDRSPWGNFWFESVGARTSSGLRVDADQAMRLTAVYACVRVLAESFAVLPFRLYRSKDGGGRTMVKDHWLYRLFARAPNRFQTPFEWREMLQGHLVLRGNAFCRIGTDATGGIEELMPMHPDRVKIEMLDNGSYRYRYTGSSGDAQILRRDQVWHLRGISGDGVIGLNPIEVCREAIAGGLSAQEYANRYFANDAKPSGGWIEMPGTFATKEAGQQFRSDWQTQYGGINRGKTSVLTGGMKYHEIGINNRDSQFLESRSFSVTDMARMFRIPPHLIGDLSRSTNNNIEQQSLEFVTHTMTPWAERWESSIETMLLGDEELEVDFDFGILLRGDLNGRSTYYHNGILDGWLTRNEARLREGMNPLDGLDEPLRPLNMAEEGKEGEAAEPAAPAKSDNNNQTEPLDGQGDANEEQNARQAQLLRGNAERMARRLMGGKTLSANVLAEALCITQEQAAHWLAHDHTGMTEGAMIEILLTLGTEP